jgi:hypothetical protein
MTQINLFEDIVNVESKEEGRNVPPIRGQEDFPFLVIDGVLYCKDCGRVITPEHGLPVDEQSVIDAFLNSDPDSTMDYLDLATGEILSLNFDDDGHADSEELQERLWRTEERYLYLEPLTPAEFIRIVSGFVLRLPDSIAKGALRRAIKAGTVSFPSDVDTLLSPYPDVKSQWNSFRDLEVFRHAREWIEIYASAEIKPTFDG